MHRNKKDYKSMYHAAKEEAGPPSMPLPKMKTQAWGQEKGRGRSWNRQQFERLGHMQLLSDGRADGTYASARQIALDDYRRNRENGTQVDNPSQAYRHDGAYTFEKGRGSNRDPESTYVTYTEGPGDKKWMAEKDRNYCARLKREKATAEKQKTEAVRKRHEPEKQRKAALEKRRAEKAVAPGPSSTPIRAPGEVTLSFEIDPKALHYDRNDEESILGEGSYSIVYRGTYQFQDVAVKELKGVNLSEKALYQVKNEVDIMSRLNSMHIVRFHGACFQKPYRIVMEYMRKGSLYGVLQSKEPLSWSQRYRIGLDVTIGLLQMHEQSPPILHRDLKSLNVLLDKDYRAKLTDFGLSKIKTETASTTQHTGGVGSRPWMAPELFGLRPKFSKASDVYALGMVLWELASRELPYNEVADPVEIRDAVRDGEREELPSDCPYAFAQLIQLCWTQKREERPSARLAAESLTGLFSDAFKKEKEMNPALPHGQLKGIEAGIKVLIEDNFLLANEVAEGREKINELMEAVLSP